MITEEQYKNIKIYDQFKLDSDEDIWTVFLINDFESPICGSTVMLTNTYGGIAGIGPNSLNVWSIA